MRSHVDFCSWSHRIERRVAREGNKLTDSETKCQHDYVCPVEKECVGPYSLHQEFMAALASASFHLIDAQANEYDARGVNYRHSSYVQSITPN